MTPCCNQVSVQALQMVMLVPSQCTNQAGTRVQDAMWTPRVGNWGLRLSRRCAQGGLEEAHLCWQHGLTRQLCHHWQDTVSCNQSLLLNPRPCHDCRAHMSVHGASPPSPGPGAGSRDVFRPQIPMQTKALPWAVMVSIDADIDSACPSSAESSSQHHWVAALWGPWIPSAPLALPPADQTPALSFLETT